MDFVYVSAHQPR